MTLEQGSPTLRDVAIQLGRIPRFNGALKVFYPVLAHSLVVAQLVPEEDQIYALLHDAAECIVGDTPRTIKTTAQKVFEDGIQCRIVKSLGLDWPALDVVAKVKEADDRALGAEARVLGSPKLAEYFPWKDAEAEELVLKMAQRYEYKDYLHPDGKMVKWFERWAGRLLGVKGDQVELKFE